MHAVRVTIICDECVRIEYAPGGRFCDQPSLFAIHGPAGAAADGVAAGGCFTTSAEAGAAPIVVETKRVRLEYVPDGRPPHGGNMRGWVVHPCPPSDVPVQGGRVVWRAGAANKHNLGGTLSTLDGLRGAYPIGEGLLARDGWHVVDDSQRHLLVDGWARTREQEGLVGNTDWYLFAYGDDYAAALRAMGKIAGRVPMPRRYALGSWYSRYWPYTSDEFRGIVDEFDVHGFPLDVLVLDMDWHKDGWTGWSWNRKLIPDPEDLLAWLHARGLAVTLNLHPSQGVGPHEDRYAAFMRALGRAPDGSTVPFDAGDRAYMRALFEEVHRPLEKQGVDFWWVDWQQEKYVRSIPELTNLRWLNHLYFEHTSRAPSGDDAGVRGLAFSRWAGDEGGPEAGTEWGMPATGGWGDHRYPIHFSGDAHTGWEMLAFQVPFTAAAGNIGCFFWSHDIGGHFGPRLEEATARWVQFGALSAALRLHSARTGSLDRRPWTYEERFCESMRKAFALRAALMPYIYTSVRGCHEKMLPLLRPMYLGWAREERAYRVPGQYLLGRDLLCAPVVEAGAGERCVAGRYVWFPGNVGCGMWDVECKDKESAHPTSDTRPPTSAWYDLTTGERHEAGAESIVSADIDRSPVFVRAGVLLPTRPPGARRMGTEPLKTLVLRTFGDGDGDVCESELYEDDGLSRGHEGGRLAVTPLRAVWKRAGAAVRLEATIGPTRGAFDGQLPERKVELHVGAVHRVVSATVDGRSAEWAHDSAVAAGFAVVSAGKCDIRREIRVGIEFEEVDARLISHRVRQADFAAALGKPVESMDLRAAVVAVCGAAGVRDEAADARMAALLGIGAGIGAVMEDHSIRLVDSLGWIEGARAEAEIVERLGSAESVVDRRTVVLAPTGGHALAGSVELPSTPLDPPPVGLRASRLVRFAFKLHGAPMVLSATAQTRLTPLSEFLVVGPFNWDWHRDIGETVYAPDGAKADAGASFDGRGGGRISWRRGVRGAKWEIDLRASLGERGGLAYAATTLLSPRRQKATIHFQCGDKLIAWLNGTKIITLDDHSTHGSPRPLAEVVLESGPNELLIKTTDGGGGWGFVASVEGETGIAQEIPGHSRPG